jgi:hypothetical protein
LYSLAALVRSQLRDPSLNVSAAEGSRELRISEQLATIDPQSRRNSSGILLPPRAEVKMTGLGSTALAAESVIVSDILRPETCLTRLGARRLELPIGYGSRRSISPSRVTAGWINYELQESESTREIQFGSSSVTPREMSVVIDVSRAFLRYAVESESMLQLVMRSALESEQERVQIVGSGVGAEPWGVLRAAQAGVIATQPGGLTYGNLLVALQSRVSAGARLRRCGWLFSAEDFAYVSALQRDSGGAPALESASGAWSLAGLRAEFSEALPAGHAICGDFSTMAIVFLGTEEMLVNPYSKVQQQTTIISLHQTLDTCIDRPSFLAVVEP